MVAGEDANGNLEGNCRLTCTMCGIIVDTMDNPQYHSKEARCAQIEIHEKNLTIELSFQRFVEMNVLVTHRLPCGNGLEYGLANQFVDPLLQQSRFDVPKPPFYLMHAALRETSFKDSSKEDKSLTRN